MSPQPQTIVEVGPPSSQRRELAHWHCCHHIDLLLCGKDGRGMRPARDDEPQCVPCDIAANDGYCPRYGRCPTDDEVWS